MTERRTILARLREEFDLWQGHLASLNERTITSSRLPNGWSVKDLMAHLMAWQQVTLARLETARRNEGPELPDWLDGESPENEAYIHRFNARIYEVYRDEPWSRVHGAWVAGYGRILELAEGLPDAVLLAAGRYPWLDGEPLIAVLHGTYEHHHVDHLGALLGWLEGYRGGDGG